MKYFSKFLVKKFFWLCLILAMQGISCAPFSTAPKSASLAIPVYKEISEETVDEPQMHLRGFGTKSLFTFKALEAGLYLEKDDLDADPLRDISKRLEVRYFVNIPGRKLSQFTIQTMKENVSKEEYARLAPQIKEMSQYFVDLKPRDKFALVYVPNVGTKFLHNDEVVGVIEGESFARALFSVWFGKKPFDQRLKNQILGIQSSRSL